MADESPRVQEARKLQRMADESPRVQEARKMQRMADEYNNLTKYKISQPNDPAEKEANKIAGKVTGVTSSAKKVDKKEIPRKEKSHDQTNPVNAPNKIDEAISSAGASLPKGLKNEMEIKMNRDFSHVKVHNNKEANESAAAINAKAYTKGSDIVFAKEEYNPGSREGRHLIAHELVHVGQQGKHSTGNVNKKDIVHRELDDKILTNGISEYEYPTISIFVPTQLTAAIEHLPGQLQNSNPSSGSQEKEVNVFLDVGTKVELITKNDNSLFIRYIPENSNNNIVYYGFIEENKTNIAPFTDLNLYNNLKNHNSICSDMVTTFYKKVDSKIDQWMNSVINQGTAYVRAYNNFNNTLKEAEKEQIRRADFYDAVLTTICSGALGFLGEIASKSVHLLLKSEAVMGTIEDVVQTAIGEAIDIKKQGWYEPIVSSNTDPLEYQNSMENSLRSLRSRFTLNMFELESYIQMSPKPINMGQLLIDLYKWWNTCPIIDPPLLEEEKQIEVLAQEMEITFWKNYILEYLELERYNIIYKKVYEYIYPEKAIFMKLRKLGIHIEGFSTWRNELSRGWSKFWNGSDEAFDMNRGKVSLGAEWADTHRSDEVPFEYYYYRGEKDVINLINWARTYNGRKFYF